MKLDPHTSKTYLKQYNFFFLDFQENEHYFFEVIELGTLCKNKNIFLLSLKFSNDMQQWYL